MKSQYNQKLYFTFISYIIIILAFAGIYYSLYKNDEANFIFGSNIKNARIHEIQAANQEKLDIFEKNISALLLAKKDIYSSNDSYPVIKEINKHYSIIESSKITTKAGTYFFKKVISGKNGKNGVSRQLTIANNNDNSVIIDTIDFQLPTSIDSWKGMISSLLKSNLKLKTELLETIKQTSDIKKDIWNFLDFVYFSTVTQSTVGYGEIIPNSSLIRIIVVFQVLIGLGLFIIVINFSVKT